jgi:hypothetical protein
VLHLDLIREEPPAARTVLANVPPPIHAAIGGSVRTAPERAIVSGFHPEETEGVAEVWESVGLTVTDETQRVGGAATGAMTEPAGQLTTEISSPDGSPARTVVSAAREVEQGARSMLLLVDGLFRLDVIPEDDTIQTVLRCLAPEERAELRHEEVGGADSSTGAPGSGPPSTGRFGGDVVLIGPDSRERIVARLLVGSICHPERGRTVFTAQATLL